MTIASKTAVRVAQLVPRTEAEGPGARFALWVQGCTLRCPGCCNPEMFAATGGDAVPVEELSRRILATPGIEGLSLLGGEPFEQAAALAVLCRAVRNGGVGGGAPDRNTGLSVMVFTGYRLAELRASEDAGVAELLAATDLLVDGRYDRTRPDSRRRWIGSTNQELHFLTPRYAPDDPRFLAPNTVEIHLVDGKVLVNGWPALASRLVDRR